MTLRLHGSQWIKCFRLQNRQAISSSLVDGTPVTLHLTFYDPATGSAVGSDRHSRSGTGHAAQRSLVALLASCQRHVAFGDRQRDQRHRANPRLCVRQGRVHQRRLLLLHAVMDGSRTVDWALRSTESTFAIWHCDPYPDGRCSRRALFRRADGRRRARRQSATGNKTASPAGVLHFTLSSSSSPSRHRAVRH
jgi:hypothetical protein